jgi:hypothetical protein
MPDNVRAPGLLEHFQRHRRSGDGVLVVVLPQMNLNVLACRPWGSERLVIPGDHLDVLGEAAWGSTW